MTSLQSLLDCDSVSLPARSAPVHLAVVGVFFRRSPSEICDTVVGLVAVEVSDLMSGRWARREKLLGDKSMHGEPLTLSVHHQADGKVAILVRELGKLTLAIAAPVVFH